MLGSPSSLGIDRPLSLTLLLTYYWTSLKVAPARAAGNEQKRCVYPIPPKWGHVCALLWREMNTKTTKLTWAFCFSVEVRSITRDRGLCASNRVNAICRRWCVRFAVWLLVVPCSRTEIRIMSAVIRNDYYVLHDQERSSKSFISSLKRWSLRGTFCWVLRNPLTAQNVQRSIWPWVRHWVLL